MRGRLLGLVVIAIVLTAGAGVADASFSAHGSVEQVYATGLAPAARASLLDARGKTVASVTLPS